MWSGHVTFGLVSIPVGIHAALEASERIAFRQLHRKDMAPIRYKKFCSEEDVEVPADEIVKGYEVRKGEYAPVEKEELDQVQAEVGEGDRTIEIPADRINLEFVLGNKVMVGTVNANRRYFEMGVGDMAQAEAEYPGWLKRLLTHPVRGLENYRQLIDTLTTAKGAIKVFCEVADL